MIRYFKLFDMLTRRGLKKGYLLKAITGPTLAKLNHGESITTDTVCKICKLMECQPGDIMEYVPDETK